MTNMRNVTVCASRVLPAHASRASCIRPVCLDAAIHTNALTVVANTELPRTRQELLRATVYFYVVPFPVWGVVLVSSGPVRHKHDCNGTEKSPFCVGFLAGNEGSKAALCFSKMPLSDTHFVRWKHLSLFDIKAIAHATRLAFFKRHLVSHLLDR